MIITRIAALLLASTLSLSCGSGGGDGDGDTGTDGDVAVEPDGVDADAEDVSDGTGDVPVEPDVADVDEEDVTTTGPHVLLGEGGFFGISGAVVGDLVGAPGGSFAIGAHYADISDGTGEPVQAGRVYVFDNGSFPGSVEEAVLVLEPPDGAPGGGFGWSMTGHCDFDDDGFTDIAVGNHLYSDLPLTACGRVVVFWGDADGIDPARHSYHMLSADIRASSDALGQTVLCADLDGDGHDDLVATGQNGGPDDTGIAAVFRGSETGLPEYQDEALYPALVTNRQYFGSASLWADLDGDGLEDLAIGGWGLVKGDAVPGPHTGGVLVFAGGDDWSAGPSYGLFPLPDAEFQAGSSIALVDGPGGLFLAVGAPDWGSPPTGAVLVWEAGFPGFHEAPPLHVLVPPGGAVDTGFGAALAFSPDHLGAGRGALLAGMKYGDASATLEGTGVVAVFPLTTDGSAFEETGSLLAAPDPRSGDAFGGAVVPLDDVDGDGLLDLFVGMESHVEGDPVTGVQTGGAVFF